MDYWKTWIGLPVTFFKDDGSGYDGNHRVRAVKYLARQRNLQLQIPVRYVPKSMRFE
jgi:hypothetical protein